jgi:hypothetical protein
MPIFTHAGERGMRFWTLFVAAFTALSASGAWAQTWTGPDSSRRGYILGHAEENLETAITEICFPYIFQNAEADAWSRDRRTGIAPFPAGSIFQGLTAYLVGGSSGAIVGVGNRGNGRECTLKPDDRVDSQETLAALNGLIARMPVTMTQSAQPIAPGAFAQRITWCSPVEGPQFNALISVAPVDRPRGLPAIVVTFVELHERDLRCDPPPAADATPLAN